MTLITQLKEEFGGTWMRTENDTYTGYFSPMHGGFVGAFLTAYCVPHVSASDDAQVAMGADTCRRVLEMAHNIRRHQKSEDTIETMLRDNPASLLAPNRHVPFDSDARSPG